MDDQKTLIDVVIPAKNEEASIAKVIRDIPKGCVRNIIVANNGSADNTKNEAIKAGAIVVDAPVSGYGRACLQALDKISKHRPHPDIVVFLDGDYSDYPEELPLLVNPIIENRMDLMIGSRATGVRQKNSMTIPQLFGNKLATSLLKLFYGVSFTDLGPFRAIRYSSLLKLEMVDLNYGWTVEMQLKAAKQKLRCGEVPVSYRRRIGKSKVSGTVKGTILAGYKILYTIFKYL